MDKEVSASDSVTLAETSRTEAFSDGVFAIVITLLVLEIHRPDVQPGNLAGALLAAWPAYAANVLAFVYVGVIWLNHHSLFRVIRRADLKIQWINLAALGFTAFIPFPTGVMANAFQSGNLADERAAVAAYALVAGLMAAAWLPIFPYLQRHPKLAVPKLPADFFARQIVRPIIGVVCYALAALTGWFVHPLVGICFIVFMVGYHTATSEGIRTDAHR